MQDAELQVNINTDLPLVEEFLQLNVRLFKLLEHWLHMDNWAPLGPKYNGNFDEQKAKNKHSKKELIIKKKKKQPCKRQVYIMEDKFTHTGRSNT